MQTEQTELKLYIENVSQLYPQRKSIELNLLRKLYKNKFDIELSVKLWSYWVEEGVKRYSKEFGDGTPSLVGIFTKSDREAVARELAEEFLQKFESGEFDSVEVFKGKYL
jgi:hypothetical protein